MADFRIKKGMDIPLAGPPGLEIVDAPAAATVSLNPTEFHGVKPRLDVKEGDVVKRGTPLFHNKRYERFRGCAPAAGTVKAIVYGPRRVVERIEIEPAAQDEAEAYPRYTLDQLRSLTRDQALDQLLATGYLACIRQRPFSNMADPEAKPKAVFVNGMPTAPFRTDLRAALVGREDAFIAGLRVMKALTSGSVHLVLPPSDVDLPAVARKTEDAVVHTFSGPHPAGNPSVHIHFVDPIKPGDVVWTISADELIRVGRLFLDGEVPPDRVIALGGHGVKEPARRHYRIRAGAALAPLFKQALGEGELRVLNGDVLSGIQLPLDGYLPFLCSGITVIPEIRDRHLLGWLAPGTGRFSLSRAYLSTWFRNGKRWELGTSRNGSLRAMVLTGLYDKYMPMNIMVDFLVRAVLANDTDEAVKLGLLETDPEDFALCAFACPSKMDLVGIIRKGLAMVEEEGL